ncbi:MAG: hypothetical protein MRY76_07900 [Pseudomonadales bacterium]|nr:hypothetical protein [Pseudomonadales bacterium]
MTILSRVSCHYDPNEDRIRLTGEAEDGNTRVLWSSHRLLKRLLPHLVQRLESNPVPDQGGTQTTASDISNSRQGFAQETAAAKIKLQNPVQADDSQLSYLIKEVDIKANDEGVALIFKHEAGDDTLVLGNEQLRQWLLILHRIWQGTEWPQDFWPTWITGLGNKPPAGEDQGLH